MKKSFEPQQFRITYFKDKLFPHCRHILVETSFDK